MQNAILVGLSRQVASRTRDGRGRRTISRTSTPPATRPTVRCSKNILHSAARADQTGSRVSFVRDRGIWHDMSQGAIERTGNPLDVAIDGQGFLVVQTPAGERYTRNGSMQINATGQLVTSDGYPVLGDGGPITLQPNDRQVSISKDGTISVREGTSKVDSARGKLRLVTFANAAAAAKRRRQHLQRDRRRDAGAGDQGRPGARRGREIQRARRRRDVAHDRNHPQLHPDRQPAASSRTILASRRSTSSPKSPIDPDGELDPCARSAQHRPA